MSRQNQPAVVVAGGYLLIGLLLYASDIGGMTGDWDSARRWWHLPILVALCALCLLRRRRPFLALTLGLLPVAVDSWLGPSIPVWLVAGDLIYAAALWGRRRASEILVIGLTLACLLAALAAVVASGGQWREGIVTAGLLGAFVVLPAWWATTIREHRDATESERQRAQALEQVAELDRQAAVAQERARLARDLHDVVAGHLSAIAIQSEAALAALSRRPELAGQVLTSVRANSIDALAEMRELIGLLSSNRSDGPDTAERMVDLGSLLESTRLSGNEVTVIGQVPPLPSAVDITAYRIVSEALHNAVVHAPGAPIRIELDHDERNLCMLVDNPITGVDAGPGNGLGLGNMRHRAESVGGRVDATVVDGRWQVRARIPVAGPEHEDKESK